MTSISAFTATTNKYFQVALAVVLLGLTSKTLSKRNFLNSLINDISTHNIANNGTGLAMDNSWRITAASLSASLFTFSSSCLNWALPSIKAALSKTSSQALAFANTSPTHKYLEIPLEFFLTCSIFSVSTFHTTYMTSLLGSESLSNVFWFVNLIVQVSDFVSGSCSSMSDLLNSYNVTGISDKTAFENYFGVPNITSQIFTLGLDVIDGVISNYTEPSANVSDFVSGSCSSMSDLLNSYNVTGISDKTAFENYFGVPNITSQIFTLGLDVIDGVISNYTEPSANVTAMQLQTTLLLNLCVDCQIKKASTWLTVILWVSHALSTGLLTNEVASFYQKFVSLRALATDMAEIKNAVVEKASIDLRQHESAPEHVNNDARSVEFNDINDTVGTVDKDTTNNTLARVFLVFDHRWGLFDIEMKDGIPKSP